MKPQDRSTVPATQRPTSETEAADIAWSDGLIRLAEALGDTRVTVPKGSYG